MGIVWYQFRLEYTSYCRHQQPHSQYHHQYQKTRLEVQFPLLAVTIVTLAHILHYILVPFLVVFNKTTTFVEIYALQMHPNRQHYDIQVSQNSPVQRKYGVEVNPRHEHPQRNTNNYHNVQNLLQ